MLCLSSLYGSGQTLVLSREWGNVANPKWFSKDMVAACGAGKQRLDIIPSRKLVVVRQGKLSRGFSDMTLLAKLLNQEGAN